MLRGAFKIAILAIVVYKVVENALFYGFGLHYKKHHPGECSQVPGVDFGSEDFEITKDGLAFITSGLSLTMFSDSYKEFLKSKNFKGNIFLYDFKQPNLGARKLKVNPSKDLNLETFHPHGISLLEDGVKGEHLLYVINHPDNKPDAVEKFRYLPKTNELVHLKSFTSDTFHTTNDLAVTAEDKFYISNYLYFKNHILSLMEQIVFPVGFGSIVYFNGTDYRVEKSQMLSPNGMSLSRDKRYLYVNLPPLKSVNVFEVKDDTSLVEIQSVALHTLADNLHLSQSGDAFFTGTHPILHKTVSHLTDTRDQAPSSVLYLPLKDGKIVTEGITELFYDHGDLISGASIAAVYNNKLLIGSVASKLVTCDVKVKI